MEYGAMCVRGAELRCVPDLEIGVRIIGEAGRVEGDGVRGTWFSSFCTGRAWGGECRVVRMEGICGKM